MLHLQKLVFISASIYYANNVNNRINTSNLQTDLVENELDHVKVIGCYEGVKEDSFIVTINSSHDLDVMIQLGKYYNQDSILYRDHEGNSILIFMDGRESINLGKMVQVSEKEALSSIAYTYVPNLNSYWIAK